MGPPHLGVYLCKAENEIGGDQRGITLTGETFCCMLTSIMTIYYSLCKSKWLERTAYFVRSEFQQQTCQNSF